MPSAVRKPAAAKKAAPAKELPVFTLEAEAQYQTKGTFRLNETGEKDDQLIGTVYLRKAVLGGVQPAKIRVTVEILDEGEVTEK